MTSLPNPFSFVGDEPSSAETSAAAFSQHPDDAAAGRFVLDESRFLDDLSRSLSAD